MRIRLLPTLAVAALLVVAGCQATLVAFVVPPVATPGQVFQIRVQAGTTNQYGNAGGVLQLPVGFTLVGIASSFGSGTLNEPSLLAMYTPEPGHYLISWAEASTVGFLGRSYQIFVRAPATPTVGTIKIALAAAPLGQALVATSPAGITAFAQIVAPTHAQPIAVTDASTAPFATDAIGLPFEPSLAGLGVALADLDGDGDDDLAGVTHTTAGGSRPRTWLRGSGDWNELGNAMPAGGQQVASGDVDGDGFVDLAVSDAGVYFGDGAGGWSAGPPLPLLGPTRAVAVGDVDGDGRDDVAFGGASSDFVQVFLSNANRTFTQASTGLPNQQAYAARNLLLRDVTGDGLADVVWKGVYAGDGLGNWSPSSGFVGAVVDFDAGDLDGDGAPELVVVAGSLPSGHAIYRHLGGNQWAPVASTGFSALGGGCVALVDFDRDGRCDILFGQQGVATWRNAGNLSFTLVADSGLPTVLPGYVEDFAVGDVNGDTFPDVAVGNGGAGIVVFQNRLGGLSRFGTGCAAAASTPPAIGGNGAPAIGNAGFGVVVSGGAPGTLGTCWLGLSRRTWSGAPILPLDLGAVGAPGCTVWTGPEALFAGVFDAAGELTIGVPIPANAALLRQTFFAQGTAFVPTASAFGFVFSGGLAIRVQ